MKELSLLMDILKGAQLASPAIVAVINSIRKGREEGKTDDEIKAESMAIAMETRAITETDMGDQP